MVEVVGDVILKFFVVVGFEFFGYVVFGLDDVEF